MTAKDPELLRTLFAAKGRRTIKQIASRFHVAKSTASNWVNGHSMNAQLAKCVAEFLGYKTEDLFYKTPRKKN